MDAARFQPQALAQQKTQQGAGDDEFLPRLPHGESVRPGRAPLEKVSAQSGGFGGSAVQGGAPDVDLVRRRSQHCGSRRPVVRDRSHVNRTLTILPTEAHHQAVRHRHGLIGIGRLLAVGTDGDAAALDVTARFLVALGQIQQHQQLRHRDLAIGQVRRRYLYFGDLRRVLSL